MGQMFLPLLFFILTRLIVCLGDSLDLFSTVEVNFRRVDSRNNVAEGGQCFTPAGRTGRCVLFKNCAPAILLYESRSTERNALPTLKESICSVNLIRRTVHVCCPEIKQSTVVFPAVAPPRSILPTECGETVGGRVTDGTPTKPGEWPWLVSLGELSGSGTFFHYCGGTLITRRHVLSAAHCFYNLRFGSTPPTHARLGDHDIDNDNDRLSPVDVRIIQKLNAGYDELRRINDVVLLVLERDVKFDDYIKPVCLPFELKNRNLVGENIEIVGRGTTVFSKNGGVPISSAPLKGKVNVVSNEACGRIYQSELQGRSPVIDNRVICAGTSTVDACQGDSGGPAHYSINNKYYLVGVVSYGVGCGTTNIPGVYMRVSEYLDWITANL